MVIFGRLPGQPPLTFQSLLIQSLFSAQHSTSLFSSILQQQPDIIRPVNRHFTTTTASILFHLCQLLPSRPSDLVSLSIFLCLSLLKPPVYSLISPVSCHICFIKWLCTTPCSTVAWIYTIQSLFRARSMQRHTNSASLTLF